MNKDAALPLNGIRIADFSQILAGPYATLLLAFLGAEVIRIENRERLDLPHRRYPGRSHDMNLNKLSVTIDLTRPGGVALVKKLVAKSDAVMESNRPGVAQRLGVDYEVLREVKPDIIYLSISGFGATGPESQYKTYAAIFSGMGGLAHITGYPDGIPTEFRGSADLRIGEMAAYALMTALIHRLQTGRGQYIDLSATESLICRIGHVVMDYTMNRRIGEKMGNKNEAMAPHNCYRCRGKDCWVSIAAGSDAEWHRLCQAMAKPELLEDSRFETSLTRWQNQEELDKIISGWTVNYTDYQVMEILQSAGIAAMPVLNAAEIFSDPHLGDRGFIREVTHSRLGKRLVFGPPWRLSGAPAPAVRPEPLVGEHNDYVFREILGLAPEEISRLEQEGVIN